ncbi:Mechanosensitive ion channel [Muriicola jejuensis]|uniref:Mechanosensitive ion channel n=1 Tax=Muriicola jejuensis TaxID=504488 RepID=A0A6P0UFS1_9FLAO|nr:mechanosensitive ion channel domain-containing protein [Muriicola jejuensis]NER11472.1 mechanosensitive ion channel [Muriicola jejuensis]SMP20600.1 Mechanosensitive ion channel [Muriicola jejuensis]
MEDFILGHYSELLSSGIILVVVVILRFLTHKTVRKVGSISELNQARTRLVSKYISFGFTVLAVVALILIWGVNIKELGLILSSVFAVIGVALFAQWSILSNVTAGIILFFSFPFKIGDRIQIMDKDLETSGTYLIEDIRAYHIHLRKDNGQLVTYPNNLMLQKAVCVVSDEIIENEGSDAI